jgi:hypothetical protein
MTIVSLSLLSPSWPGSSRQHTSFYARVDGRDEPGHDGVGGVGSENEKEARA